MKQDMPTPAQGEGLVPGHPLRNRRVTFRAYGGPDEVVMVEEAEVAPPGPGAVGLAALDIPRALGLRAVGLASSARRALVLDLR